MRVARYVSTNPIAMATRPLPRTAATRFGIVSRDRSRPGPMFCTMRIAATIASAQKMAQTTRRPVGTNHGRRKTKRRKVGHRSSRRLPCMRCAQWYS
jgi:hypothetical protein